MEIRLQKLQRLLHNVPTENKIKTNKTDELSETGKTEDNRTRTTKIVQKNGLLERLPQQHLFHLQRNLRQKDGNQQNESKTRQHLLPHPGKITTQGLTQMHHAQTQNSRLTH